MKNGPKMPKWMDIECLGGYEELEVRNSHSSELHSVGYRTSCDNNYFLIGAV